LLLFSIALPVINTSHDSVGEELARRARRLLVPWASWSAFYAAWFFVRSIYKHEDVMRLLEPNGAFFETTRHLWYLPFVFVAALLVLPIYRLLGRMSSAFVCFFLSIVGGLTLVVSSRVLQGFEYSPPYSEWTYSAATLPFGLAIGIAIGRGTSDNVRGRLALIGLGGVVAALTVAVFGNQTTSVSYGIGVPLACLAFIWNPSLSRFMAAVVSLPLGVYVLHPFIRILLYRFHYLSEGSAAMAVATIIATAVLAWVLRQTPLRAIL
jgi:peptidoglycan/LPS O-acetylase OafA/YrhL